MENTNGNICPSQPDGGPSLVHVEVCMARNNTLPASQLRTMVTPALHSLGCVTTGQTFGLHEDFPAGWPRELRAHVAQVNSCYF